MTVGIIGAMDEEVHAITERMGHYKEKKLGSVAFITGEMNGHPIVLLKSGIGKVNAAIATTLLLEHYKPNYVINTGSAGGFANHLEVGDIVIGKEVVYHDVDV